MKIGADLKVSQLLATPLRECPIIHELSPEDILESIYEIKYTEPWMQHVYLIIDGSMYVYSRDVRG